MAAAQCCCSSGWLTRAGQDPANTVPCLTCLVDTTAERSVTTPSLFWEVMMSRYPSSGSELTLPGCSSLAAAVHSGWKLASTEAVNAGAPVPRTLLVDAFLRFLAGSKLTTQ